MDSTSAIIFIISAFALGAVLIIKREQIPAGMRRWLALIAIVLVAFAFFTIVASFLNLG